MEVVSLFCHNSLRNMVHLIVADNQRDSICIDPYDAKLVATELARRKLNLTHIINTHEHWDHVRGIRELKESTNCDVWAVPGVEHSDHLLQGGEGISLGSITVSTVATPGHTMKHVCFLAATPASSPALFSGDMLFNAGVGNCHNGGDVDTMFTTFEGFFRSLAGDVNVYPGHDYMAHNLAFAKEQEPDNEALAKMESALAKAQAAGQFLVTTMAEERQFNPFLRLDSRQIQARTKTSAGERRDVFRALRSRRNDW